MKQSASQNDLNSAKKKISDKKRAQDVREISIKKSLLAQEGVTNPRNK